MSAITEYKCPCCNGIISFNSDNQKLTCSYCETEFTVEVIEAYNQSIQPKNTDLNWQVATIKEWTSEEEKNLVAYTCQSCGGQILTDKVTIATTCPYCDNKIVINKQVEGVLKPDLVIPFHFDKQAAMQALKDHFKDKKLLPQAFKNENHIDEIKGIYVPYWLYDCDVLGDVSYRAEKVQRYSDVSYDYKKTDHYMLKRKGTVAFNKVPTDAASQIKDELMDSIEPYDYSQMVEFNAGYLAGYMAERYDVTIEQSNQKINERITKSVQALFNNTAPAYMLPNKVNESLELNRSKVQYALLPVWILNTSWNNQKYVFVMNGQTGKFVGDLPVDSKLYRKYYGIYFLIGTAIVTLFSLMFV